MPKNLLLKRAAAVLAAATVAVGLAACSSSPAPAPSSGLETVTPGKLTIATGETAYYPYVIDDKPESG
ncbi:MAG TPA: amino acid ABC transporter substrate-binding protein, partial [Microbacteriaceae bacterium]|nr:amino acid ABC transporter substrate-binding protein [Microbacteriaceae bacterium]